MNMLRRISIGLLSFLCVAAVSLTVYLATLQSTIFDRSVVKGWLVNSGVYHNNIVPILLQSGAAANTNTADPATTTGQFQIPASAIKIALERTFTADYVRTQAEGTLDQFYDWLEGKSPEFNFSIPIDQKRETFIAELAQAAEPSIAALPVCTSQPVTSTQCRPANIAPDLYAQRVIADNVNQSGFFKQPIGIKNDASSTSANSLVPKLPTQIQQIVPLIGPIMIGLVGLGIISVALIIWLAPIGERLVILVRLARRIFFAQIFTFLAALFFLWSFQTGFFKFSSLLPNQPIIISETLGDIVKLAVTDLASKLGVLSGIVCVFSLGVWLALHVWQRRANTQVTVVPPPSDPDLGQMSS